MLPHAILIIATLGTIIWGWATPTEAAAMGVVGAAFLAVVYREFTWQRLKDAVYNTLLQSSTVLFLAVAGNVFGAVFSRLGTATVATNALIALADPPVAMLALIMVVIFLLGWPFEWPAIILVFVPLLQPVIMAHEDRHAVVRHAHRREPPDRLPVAAGRDVGILSQGGGAELGLGDIYRGMGQFMVLQLIGLALCIVFPGISLWFPRWLFGK